MSSERLPIRLGDYEVVRAIARGGMGAVFEVQHRQTGMRYAAKTLLRPSDSGARERFQREAELLARCDRHQGVVKVHALGEEGGALYMILDLVQGEDLGRAVDRAGVLPPRRVAEIARDVADALAFVHGLGVLHRDVKPSNVLLGPGGEGPARLTDFGVSTARDLERLTKTGVFVGTLYWVSPEQARGERAGPPSDVFSLGAVMFYALTGAFILGAVDGLAYLGSLGSKETIRDVRTIEPSVPAPLARIVGRALSKAAPDRPTARALASQLGDFLEGRAEQTKSLRVFAFGLAAILALALPGAGLAWSAWQKSRELEAIQASIVEARAAAPERGAVLAHEARLRAEAARDRGIAGAASAAEAAADLEEEVACARAAKAKPEAVLALLAGARSPAARLLRVRALAALGRTGEILQETEGLEGPQALELRGDAAMIVSDWKTAEEAYGLDSSLRLKHAEAAAFAGDADAVREDLRLLLQDPKTARDPRVASALYRRALEPENDRECARDFDSALRLAPPAPPIAHEVAKGLDALAAREVAAWQGELLGHLQRDMALGDADVERFQPIFRRMKTAYAIDPALPRQGYAYLFFCLTVLEGKMDSSRMARFARRFLAEWPDDPAWLWVLGESLSKGTPEEQAESLRSLQVAIDGLRPPPPYDPEEGKLLAQEIARSIFGLMRREGRLEPDLDRLAKVVERSNCSDDWFALAERYRLARRFDEALAALDRGRRSRTKSGKTPPREPRIECELEILWGQGQTDKVLERVTKLKDDESARPWGLRAYAMFFRRAGRHEEVVAAVDPNRIGDTGTLAQLSRSLVALGRKDEARAVLARMRKRGATKEDIDPVKKDLGD